jgi:hypothetical protein
VSKNLQAALQLCPTAAYSSSLQAQKAWPLAKAEGPRLISCFLFFFFKKDSLEKVLTSALRTQGPDGVQFFFSCLGRKYEGKSLKLQQQEGLSVG